MFLSQRVFSHDWHSAAQRVRRLRLTSRGASEASGRLKGNTEASEKAAVVGSAATNPLSRANVKKMRKQQVRQQQLLLRQQGDVQDHDSSIDDKEKIPSAALAALPADVAIQMILTGKDTEDMWVQ